MAATSQILLTCPTDFRAFLIPIVRGATGTLVAFFSISHFVLLSFYFMAYTSNVIRPGGKCWITIYEATTVYVKAAKTIMTKHRLGSNRKRPFAYDNPLASFVAKHTTLTQRDSHVTGSLRSCESAFRRNFFSVGNCRASKYPWILS